MDRTESFQIFHHLSGFHSLLEPDERQEVLMTYICIYMYMYMYMYMYIYFDINHNVLK
jgi:hypothetical protein